VILHKLTSKTSTLVASLVGQHAKKPHSQTRSTIVHSLRANVSFTYKASTVRSNGIQFGQFITLSTRANGWFFSEIDETVVAPANLTFKLKQLYVTACVAS
jgi:hypothetical protein